MLKRKIGFLGILLAFIMLSTDINAQCNVKEVVLFVEVYILPLANDEKDKRKEMRTHIRKLCEGKTTIEGCRLKDVMKYAEKGQSAKQIEEQCK